VLNIPFMKRSCACLAISSALGVFRSARRAAFGAESDVEVASWQRARISSVRILRRRSVGNGVVGIGGELRL